MKRIFTIVCLGDSITGACDLARFIKWPQILDAMCQAACGSESIRVLNCGVAGNTTAQMLARLDDDVLCESPDIVVLLAGGNDAGQQVPRSATAANLALLLAPITASGARLLGLNYHLLVQPGHEDAAWRHLPSNNDLLNAAVLQAGGAFVDTAHAIATAATTMPLAELAGPDAVHLSPGGELIYARTVFATLRDRGWLPIG